MKKMSFYLIPLFILFSCTFRTDPGEGIKIGRIVKVSRQGLIFKTWEVTLVRGGLNDGSGVIGSSFEFTIENDSLAKEAVKLMENQSEVMVYYKTEFISSIKRSESYSPNFCVEIVKK
jgi:hypothetical protein